VALLGTLVTIVGGLLAMLGKVGYDSVLRSVHRTESKGRATYDKVVDIDKRLVRVETLVINGKKIEHEATG